MQEHEAGAGWGEEGGDVGGGELVGSFEIPAFSDQSNLTRSCGIVLLNSPKSGERARRGKRRIHTSDC